MRTIPRQKSLHSVSVFNWKVGKEERKGDDEEEEFKVLRVLGWKFCCFFSLDVGTK